MTSSGCAKFIEGARGPSVQIPKECENLAETVRLPDPKKGQDMRLIAAQNRKAAAKANAQLDATRECQVRLREEYEGVK